MRGSPLPIPSVDALLVEPAQASTLPPEVAQALLIELAVLQPLLIQRALLAPRHEGREDELLTIPEVARRLKVSDYRAYELARQGVLKSVRLGKSVRVTASAITDYLARQGG